MNIVESIKAMTSKLSSAMKAASGITDQIGQIRAAIANKRRELEAATNAPLPLSDLDARISAVVRESAQLWLESGFGVSLVSGERALGDPHLRGSIRLPWSASQAPPWGAMCASDPEGAERFLRAIAARVPYQAGPPAHERPALVARLTAELQELERADEEAVDAAAAGGITIEHRPEVTARRAQEARRHQIERDAVLDRRRREETLDAQHDVRTRSAYLADPAGVELRRSVTEDNA